MHDRFNFDVSKSYQRPDLRRQILASDIIIIGSPIWLGQPSSVAKRVPNEWTRFLVRPTRTG
jgi:multimeric flavodoxin WrbA